MRKTLMLASAAVAVAGATPAAALTALPPAAGSILFDNFFALDGSFMNCSKMTSGLGAGSCNGFNLLFDPEPHVTGVKSGTASITNSPTGGPTVTVSLDVSGVGVTGAKATLDYYVTVLPLGTLPTAGLQIPLLYEDAGEFQGSVSNGVITAEAATAVSTFAGHILVDGLTVFQNDDISDFKISDTIGESYDNTHHVVFDFGTGDSVAKVSLLANCGAGSLNPAGIVSEHCAASADPIFGFDQGAFDAAMGDKTFNLSDFFKIEVSSGLEAAAGVPEPASWALMIAGFGLAGAMLRRRKPQAA